MTLTSRLPPAFAARMRSVLGAEFDSFVEALGNPEEGLRVNTLRLSGPAFREISPFALRDLGFAPEAFVLERTSGAGKHPYHAAGVYYLQDPGAMMVGSLVAARPGERVLDLSAAPGGKATHLAAGMAGEGLLVANDVSRSRARELVRNIERCGVTNAIVTSESPARLAARFGPAFDRVLVDAPCSGESMFHKSEAAREDWSPEAVAGCARRQHDLLLDAAGLVVPGGSLFYSTCTFSTEENEGAVDRFLQASPAFEPAPLPPLDGAVAVTVGGKGDHAAAYRLWPHRLAGAGHFVAALRKRDGEEAPSPRAPRHSPEREVVRIFTSFADEVFPGARFDVSRLALFGRELHLIPGPAVDTGGLAVLRSGLWLGTVHRDRFEPSHALALAAPAIRSPKVVDLELGDPRVDRYLEGHPMEAAGAGGWIPVAVDGFRLGWGKRVGSTVKNHYPKGLRRPG